jgi:hypothetical protein
MSASQFVYRTEETRARDGERQLMVWRRRLIRDDGDRIELGEVQRAVVQQGQEPQWQTVGGLLGRPCRLTQERFRSCGYTSNPPQEIRT